MKSKVSWVLAALCAASSGCFGGVWQGGDGSGGGSGGANGGGGGGGGGSPGNPGNPGNPGSPGNPGNPGNPGSPGGGGGTNGGITGVAGGYVDGPGGGIFVGPGMPGGIGGGLGADLGECKQDGYSNGGDYCDAQLSCENGYVYAYCEGGRGEWWCGCDTPYGSTQFSLAGDALGDACTRVADLCATAEPPPEGARDCQPAYTSAGPDYCDANRECSYAYEIADGITAQVYDYVSSYCNYAGGRWLCECYDNARDLRFDLPGDQKAPAVCTTVLDACEIGDIELTGEPTCEPRFQSGDRQYCNLDYECLQPAVVGGLQGTVSQYASTYCELDPDGGWSCQCNAPDGVQSLQVDADGGWDACTMAGNRCMGN